MATMGVLYDVLFKPIGRDGGSTMAPTTAHAAIITAAEVQPVAAAAAAADQTLPPPEWVLDERDGGSLVWRRCGCVAATSPGGRRRVEFLDAVQVRVFERDDYSGGGGGGGHDDGCADTADAADDDAARDADAEDDADDWCWDEWDASDEKLFHRKPAGPEDYPVLVAAVSVTVLGVCFGLAYLFAPVRWLFHQLLVD